MVAKECQRPKRVQPPDLTHLYSLFQSHCQRTVVVTACLLGYQEEVKKKGTNGLRGQSPAGEEPGRGPECGH